MPVVLTSRSIFAIDQDESKLREFMRKRGMVTIQDRLSFLIDEGITSFGEALRIGIH